MLNLILTTGDSSELLETFKVNLLNNILETSDAIFYRVDNAVSELMSFQDSMLFVATAKDLTIQQVIDAIKEVSWNEPEKVQLFYKQENNTRFGEAKLNL